MTAFAIAALVLAAAVLAFVLRPLYSRRAKAEVSRREANLAIYRDQIKSLDADLAAGTLAREEHDRARMELEARLLEDVPAAEAPAVATPRRTSFIVVGIAVPLVALTVYFLTGTPAALDPQRLAMPDQAQIDAMVARLAAKMREHPEDAEGWKLLGRSYTVLGRFPEAVDAYAKAAERSPRDAQLLADFADALAMARGQTLVGEPEKLVERALEIDPKNLKALALYGTAAYERKDYRKAADIWSRMLPLVPEGSEDAQAIRQNVNEARQLAGIGDPQKPAAAAPPGVRGVIKLSPELKAMVKPDDVLFVFARAAEGPPMPLAVLRGKAGDLPMSFNLNDSLAMAQGLKVSAFPKVVVAARVSKSGTAASRPGDLEGSSGPVANDAADVTVTIDRVVR